MECERCGRSGALGRSYTFHYGRKGPRSTRFELGARVDTTHYHMAGTASVWICDRCSGRRQAWTIAGLVALAVPLIAISLILVRVGETSWANAICWSSIPLTAVAWCISMGYGKRQTAGEEVAIATQKQRLRQQGYDTFLTTRQYERLH